MRQKQNLKVKAAFEGVDRKLLKKVTSSDNTISQIVNGLLPVSPMRAKEIEKATKGKVRASVLRPDVFGKN